MPTASCWVNNATLVVSSVITAQRLAAAHGALGRSHGTARSPPSNPDRGDPRRAQVQAGSDETVCKLNE